MNTYKKMAIRFAGALWMNGVCPQCGNKINTGHMPDCKKTFNKLIDPRDIESVFDEAFNKE